MSIAFRFCNSDNICKLNMILKLRVPTSTFYKLTEAMKVFEEETHTDFEYLVYKGLRR